MESKNAGGEEEEANAARANCLEEKAGVAESEIEGKDGARSCSSCSARQDLAVLECARWEPLAETAPMVLGKRVVPDALHEGQRDAIDAVMREYEVVVLDNELVRATVCPGLGGRVLSFVDVRSGADLVLRTRSVYPVRVGDENLKGWVAGGIQFSPGSTPFHSDASRAVDFSFGSDETCCWASVGTPAWVVHYELRPGLASLFQRCIVNKASAFCVSCAVPAATASSWILPPMGDKTSEALPLLGHAALAEPSLLHLAVSSETPQRFVRIAAQEKAKKQAERDKAGPRHDLGLLATETPLLHRRGRGRLSRAFPRPKADPKPAVDVAAPDVGHEETKDETPPVPAQCIGWEGGAATTSTRNLCVLAVAPESHDPAQCSIRTLGKAHDATANLLTGIRGNAFAQVEFMCSRQTAQKDFCWTFVPGLTPEAEFKTVQASARQCRTMIASPERERESLDRDDYTLHGRANRMLHHLVHEPACGEDGAKGFDEAVVRDLCGELLASGRAPSTLRLVGLLYWKLLGDPEQARRFLESAVADMGPTALLELDSLVQEMGASPQERRSLLLSRDALYWARELDVPDLVIRQCELELALGEPRRALERIRGTAWTAILCSSSRHHLLQRVRAVCDAVRAPLTYIARAEAHPVQSDFLRELNFRVTTLADLSSEAKAA